MTRSELETAAYTAAHEIHTLDFATNLATPGGKRSEVIDRIADVIRECFSVHVDKLCIPKGTHLTLGISSPPDYDAVAFEEAGPLATFENTWARLMRATPNEHAGVGAIDFSETSLEEARRDPAAFFARQAERMGITVDEFARRFNMLQTSFEIPKCRKCQKPMYPLATDSTSWICGDRVCRQTRGEDEADHRGKNV